MLPPFDEHGNLPLGIHPARIDEIASRFGYGSVEREVEIRELVELIAWAGQHGVYRLIINGSFVTDKVQPNDVDVVILPRSGNTHGEAPIDFEPSAWPFPQILMAADDADLNRWATDDFGTDRGGPTQGGRGGDLMTEHLSAQGYEQTKLKLANLEKRLAEIERRADLRGEHRQQVLRSYCEMVQQYRREIKLYEALREETTSRN